MSYRTTWLANSLLSVIEYLLNFWNASTVYSPANSLIANGQ